MSATDAVWEGVYASFAEAPCVGPGFRGDAWVTRSARTMDDLEMTVGMTGAPPLADVIATGLLVPCLAERLARHGAARVIDFGGGLGGAYRVARACLGQDAALEFLVVEHANVCAEGRTRSTQWPGLYFSDHLARDARADVVHCGSSLQYVDAWTDLLVQLGRCGAHRLVISDLPAGDVPTFVTSQRYYDSQIPYRFFSLEAFLSVTTRIGWRLLARRPHPYIVGDRLLRLPTDALPVGHRLSTTVDLLFARSPAHDDD